MILQEKHKLATNSSSSIQNINKKHNPIVTKLSIRGRKLYISLIFITQSYFGVPKKVRLH